MATYEYECAEHGVFEAVQSIKDPPLDKCPQCAAQGKDSPAPKKLISLSTFALAGSGWAKDNYSK